MPNHVPTDAELELRRALYDTRGDFDMVFTVEFDSWAPRPAVYRQAVEFSQDYGYRIPSAQQVYAALRARGFTEAKRAGVWGFRDLHVSDKRARAKRIVPAGTSAAYYKRGDRSEPAREAVFFERQMRRLQRLPGPDSQEDRATDLSPWDAPPWSSADRMELARNNKLRSRRGRRRNV